MEAIDKAFSIDRSAAKAADALEGDISLTLSEEQSKELQRFVSKTGQLPSKIEINFKAGIDRSTLIPVTVLVGAMT
ncbi:MAG: hypothetical protein Tsb0019_10540 [Roseibium sp.]